jgi:hypothetical protein
VRDRQAQVGDAGFEVILKTGNGTRHRGRIVGPDSLGKVAGDRSRRRLVAGGDPCLEL